MARTRLSRAERTALTRSELLEVAERRFYRDGYHATTLEAIAEEAGYTKGAVYSAFESKAGLFLTLIDAMIDERLEEIAAFFAEYPLGPSRVTKLAGRPVEERTQRWAVLAIEFWVHAAREPELLEQFAVRYRRMRDGLAELAQETETPLGAESWAIVTLALVNGLALERLIDPGAVPADLMARAQRLLYPPRSP
ncbi:MAG TPA: TetR/AcrR family transcriptional regulator [Solirubrobacteraceae bacterium]|jgi:AcrR family transcriptional regulator|nr:TetR/AcrR family transcriptional regulator [Solirubrobacteraceae bacterium]